MTLRTKSRGQQWTVWLCAFLVALAAYVVFTRVLYGAMNWNVLAPLQQRIVLPLFALLYLIATETRWDGVKREGEKGQGEGEQRNLASDPVVRVTHAHTSDGRAREVTSTTEKTDHPCSPSPSTLASKHLPSTVDSAQAPGEAEYVRARGMKHRTIPDVQHDSDYLELLAKSAELGYARAMAKLGEYAMRRRRTVEAYYWLWRAKRAGMKNLDRTLLQVRNAWAKGGFRRESMSKYEGFTHEQGIIGYALLCIDARHNADAAKARLAECAPEFL